VRDLPQLRGVAVENNARVGVKNLSMKGSAVLHECTVRNNRSGDYETDRNGGTIHDGNGVSLA
jgi:hypothetical protein